MGATAGLSSGATRRRGLSLLEVLISMFIMAVGLMGLAALLPVGGFDVFEATKSDRGSAVGRAAIRDVKVRGMLDPNMWMNYDITDEPPISSTPVALAANGALQNWYELDQPGAGSVPLLTPVAVGGSVCIDPMFLARAVPGPLPAGWNGSQFPYLLDNDPSTVPNLNPPNAPRMTRITLRAWSSVSAPAMSYAAAERIFTWHDDLVFDRPTDPALRPNKQYTPDGRLQFSGDYSWLVTITPQPNSETASRRSFTVSVVVFYKRPPPPSLADLNNPSITNRADGPPAERMVYADFLSGGIGWGGGDVRLRLPIRNGDPNNDPSSPATSDLPKIRPNGWLLLSAWVSDPVLKNFCATNYTAINPLINRRAVFQWYRVMAVSDGPTKINNEWTYDVTLSGPDWNPGPPTGGTTSAYIDAVSGVGGPVANTVYAALFEGVVGVYSKTMELDTWDGWARGY